MLPKMKLSVLPTPIQKLPNVSKALGGPELMVKRDDLTGLAFGGNKTRKLEYLLADAQRKGADLLLTTGAAQSNHCRQTAAAAARFGFPAILVLTGDPEPQPSGNLFLDDLLGAEVVWAAAENREQALETAYQQAAGRGNKPYLIPYGGSNAVGGFAYYQAFREMVDQLGENPPDWIVFASSSGGTQAGLAAGARVINPDVKVLGISVDEAADDLRGRVAPLATQILEEAQSLLEIREEEVLVNDHYLGEGYGVMGEPEAAAIRLFAREEGLLLDPVYTGRAAAGLIDLIRQNFFQDDQVVLFWHTGGTPGLFADRYRMDLNPG